jgi:hypothetical protein
MPNSEQRLGSNNHRGRKALPGAWFQKVKPMRPAFRPARVASGLQHKSSSARKTQSASEVAMLRPTIYRLAHDIHEKSRAPPIEIFDVSSEKGSPDDLAQNDI